MLEFGPAYGASGLGLGGIIEGHSSLEDLALALGKVPVPKDGDGVGRVLGEEADEDEAGCDGENPFDLMER